MKLFIFLLVPIFVSCSHDRKQETLVAIKCGNLFDAQNGVWKKNQLLLVQKGIIQEVRHSVIPSEAEIVDYSDYYIIPGLIDAHSHVFLNDSTRGKDFLQGPLQFIINTPEKERHALGIRRLKSLLKSGFTSVRDLGYQGNNESFILSNFGSRFYSSGSGWTPRYGQFLPQTSEEIIRHEYKLLIEPFPESYSHTLLKIYADEEPNPTITDVQVLKNWVSWAHQRSLKVSAHAMYQQSIQNAIDVGVNSIEHGNEITPLQLELMASKKIIFVPTYTTSLFLLPKLRKWKTDYMQTISEVVCKNLKAAREKKVELAFGSDNYYSLEDEGFPFGRSTLEILLAYRNCGLSPKEILKASTYTAARSMGKENEVGQLKAGAFADFIVLKKNPETDLEVLRRPKAIYQDGKRIQ